MLSIVSYLGIYMSFMRCMHVCIYVYLIYLVQHIKWFITAHSTTMTIMEQVQGCISSEHCWRHKIKYSNNINRNHMTYDASSTEKTRSDISSDTSSDRLGISVVHILCCTVFGHQMPSDFANNRNHKNNLCDVI